MAHDCTLCGEACYCDDDDVFRSEPPADCQHDYECEARAGDEIEGVVAEADAEWANLPPLPDSAYPAGATSLEPVEEAEG